LSASRPTLRGNVKALPPVAWVLFAGTFVNRLGSFVLVFLILYLTRKGYSAPQAGLAVSAYGIGSLTAAALGGHLADRIGRRRAIALSMFSAGAAVLALSQAETLPWIVLLTALVGLTSDLYRPASSALLADLTLPGQRVTAFAFYRLAINLGFTIGPALGGLLAERSFFLLFLGDALTSAIFGVVALVALPKGIRSSRAEERSGTVRVVLADRPFLFFLLAMTAISFVYFQVHSTFALQIKAHGFSTAIYGALISLNALIVTLLELPFTSVTQRLRPRPVMALGFLLIGVGFGLTAVADTVPLLAFTVLIWTLGEIVNAPVAGAYVADLAPRHMRGRYQGAFGMTLGLGHVLGPWLGTALFAWSPGGLWTTCLVLGVLAALLVLAGPDPGVTNRTPGNGSSPERIFPAGDP
jgi:MFS family permease